ncbi:uncharacterized protein [Apostichopus japonicus]|uniref:uncharacterized protein n=1 Tax=Stichopus japonicus TaxID=307972 RepID=UPI003AB7A999
MKELIPQIGLRLKFVARLKAYRQDSSATSEQSGISRQYETYNENQSTKEEASLYGVVSAKRIKLLSRAITNWWDIGRELEISDEVLDRIHIDTPGGHTNKVYQMLTKWKHQSGRNATNKRLGEALIKCGRTDLQQGLEQEDYTNGASGEELQFNGMQKKRSLDYIILVPCVFIVAFALGRTSSS